MEKKLIPYSVHLPEDVYYKLKAAAKERKASAIVRDAIVMIVQGDTAYQTGYLRAVRDITSYIKKHPVASSIGVNGESLSSLLIEEINEMRRGRENIGGKK